MSNPYRANKTLLSGTASCVDALTDTLLMPIFNNILHQDGKYVK